MINTFTIYRGALFSVSLNPSWKPCKYLEATFNWLALFQGQLKVEIIWWAMAHLLSWPWLMNWHCLLFILVFLYLPDSWYILHNSFYFLFETFSVFFCHYNTSTYTTNSILVLSFITLWSVKGNGRIQAVKLMVSELKYCLTQCSSCTAV